MASVYSEGSQKSQGGDWGWVERSVLRKDLADAAFALKPGQVSDVIDTPESVYLMLVEDKRPPMSSRSTKSGMTSKRPSAPRNRPGWKSSGLTASRKRRSSVTSQ